MSQAALVALVAGAIAAGYLLVGAFFLRFWTRTRDRLFLGFAIAFAVMAVGQVLPVIFGIPRESQGGVYLLRLAAFVLILLAIIRKNLGGRRT